MDLFYFYRYELFAFSGLGFLITSGLIIFKEMILQERNLFEEIGLSKKPSSLLNDRVVETLKVKTKREVIRPPKAPRPPKPSLREFFAKKRHEHQLRKHERELKKQQSIMDSSKAFYEQFDSVPMHQLVTKQAEMYSGPLDMPRKNKVSKAPVAPLAKRSEEPDELDIDVDAFKEQELTYEEKDAMKLAFEMDEEVQASQRGLT